ncbi:MAG: hypothetical protein IPN59_17445 [Holophaga sp.]|nr:hypothetical protein [Holophaga sp.]
MRVGASLALCLPALVGFASEEPPAKTAKPTQDAEIEALAQQAMRSSDRELQKATLAQLRKHRFRSSRAPQREYTLFAQGMLEDRLEDTTKAAATLKKLELVWPKSPYLPEAQVILGQEAAERKRFKDAESRLRRVLTAEVPAESKRRAQEWLLWSLVEQAQPEKGLSILDSLIPLGTAKPSEKGLVAMVEVLAHAKRKDQTESVLKDYRNLYPKGALIPRAELATARMLGHLGDAKESAEGLQRIIHETPNAPEADEARLALAALITDGKLNPAEGQSNPDPDQLLSEIHKKGDKKDDLGRRTLLLKLRRQVGASRWKEAIETATAIRGKDPSEEEAAQVTSLRAGAFRAWSQDLLEKNQVDTLLPHLDTEGIQSLSTEQRTVLTRRLVEAGLPSAGLTLAALAPASERATLQKLIAETTSPSLHPTEALAAAPAKGESAKDALRRAQAAMALKDYKTVRASLSKAQPGADRIAALLAFLRRYLEPTESAEMRKKDAEAWLAKASERGTDREPLVILVADLRAKAGDWRGALSLYPIQASKANVGWVALMRATCQQKLGQREAAKAILKQAIDEPGFKMERESLYKELGR